MINIIVLDDELDVLDAIMTNLSLFLKESKFSLFEHTNPLTALAELKENPIYSILITDLNMPFMNGKELIRELRKFNSTIEIFVFSGNINNDLKNDLNDYRVNKLVEKPNLNELVEVINSYAPEMS